jgi:hypothetical protein
MYQCVFVRNGGEVGCVFGVLVLGLERGLSGGLSRFLVYTFALWLMAHGRLLD